MPASAFDRVQLGHGSGGKMSARLVRERFATLLDPDAARLLSDAAVVRVGSPEIAISTDSFVVRPLIFPGGDIGSLAVHGTVNDLAMMGADPRLLTVGFVLEEGLPFETLDAVVESMAQAARDCGVRIVAGDTKVVERGKADGLYVNTTGLGTLSPSFRPAPDRARVGDAVLVSGPIGRHGIAVMAVREGLGLEVEVESDSAPLHDVVRVLRDRVGDAVHVLRDATRGGLTSALNEIACTSSVGVTLDDRAIPIPPPVAAACEVLGLDPLYVANEGTFVAFVAEHAAADAISALRGTVLGAGAARIGTVIDGEPGLVTLRTALGTMRIVDMLPGDQLPRIC
jgi:hydrogenase expression/formation protein HypE